MLKLICTACMALLTTVLAAQTTLSFCASVDNSGHCALVNTKFISSPDSSQQKICMLLRNSTGIGTPRVTYHIYSVDKAGTELLIDSAQQTIEGDWVFAWQPWYFKTPGKYKVKVLNETAEMILSKSFELFDAW